MLTWFIEWLKAALLEVQEYVRLCWAALGASATRPFYYRDIVQQFQHIGLGSLTVVLLTGSRSRVASHSISSAPARSSAVSSARR